MRISDWSSDVCSSDLGRRGPCMRSCAAGGSWRRECHEVGRRAIDLGGLDAAALGEGAAGSARTRVATGGEAAVERRQAGAASTGATLANGMERAGHHLGELGARVVEGVDGRSEEHTSELQSLMRISYAVFCLKKK